MRINPLVYVAFLASSASALEATGSIKGVLYQPDGAVLVGAVIELSSPALPQKQTRSTLEDGSFLFSSLPVGAYTLTITHPSITPIVKKIAVKKEASVSLEIPTEAMSAPRSASAESLSMTPNMQGGSLNDSEFQLLPTNRSAQAPVAFLPGVLAFDSLNPNIHGGSFRNNRHLVDGLDMTDPVTLTSLANINFDAVQAVEVATGGLSAEYNAFGGVINTLTQSGTDDFAFRGGFYVSNRTLSPQSTLSEEPFGGELVEQPLALAPEGDSELSFVVSGPIVKDKLWYHSSFAHRSGASEGVQDFDAYLGRVKLTYQFNQKNIINASVGMTPNTTRTANFNGDDRTTSRESYYATTNLSSQWTKNLSFDAKVGFISNVRAVEEVGFAEERLRIQNDVSVTYKASLAGEHALKMGLQAAPTSSSLELGPQENIPAQFRRDDKTANAIEAGLYAQDTWKLTPFVTVTPGVRFDVFSATGNRAEEESNISYSGFGPRFGVSWDPTKDGKTKLAGFAGRFIEPGNLVLPSFASEEGTILACDPGLLENPSTAFLFEECRAPAMNELSVIAERSIGAIQVGLSGNLKRQYHLFEDDQANLIFDDSGNRVIGAINGDASSSLFRIRTPDLAYIAYQGVDLYVQGRPSERSWLMASYTYSQTTGTKSEETNTQLTSFMDNPRQNSFFDGFLPWHAKHSLKAGGIYNFNFGLTAGLWFNYRSGRQLGTSAGEALLDPSDDFAQALPDFSQIDLRLQYSAAQKLFFTMDAFNLLNASTPTDAAIFNDEILSLQHQEPFSMRLGVRYQY
jgi:hypothetical protein